jgi:GT2 family glycosyltransferase
MQQRADPSVHVIIVNWNAGAHLFECLKSFATVVDDAVSLTRTTLVDNASTDGSLDIAASTPWPFPLEIIQNKENRGFAAACNQGASGSDADYLLFLNPDTMLRRHCLEVPARFLADPANNTVGIVGIQLLDAENKVARNCARRPTLTSILGQSIGLDRLAPFLFAPHFMQEWAHGQTRAVDQVMGAYYFVRRSLFAALGGFDERFFVYFEDLDFALRASELGWRSVYMAEAQAFHTGRGTTRGIRARSLFYFWRSRILFCRKHFGLVAACLVMASTLLLEPISRIMAALFTGRAVEINDVGRGFILLCSDLPNLFRRHRRHD